MVFITCYALHLLLIIHACWHYSQENASMFVDNLLAHDVCSPSDKTKTSTFSNHIDASLHNVKLVILYLIS
jgi:hypothetical protein